MSDDTPTERFDPKSNGVTPPDPLGATPQEYPPTRKLPEAFTPPPAEPFPQPDADTTTPPPKPPEKKPHVLLWWLIGIGAALLITVIVLLVILFSGGDPEPEPTADPTPTQTEEPTPEPSVEPEPSPTVEPAPVSPSFESFEAPTSANCEEGADDAPLTFSWASNDAERAYIGVQTTNAKLAPYASDLPPVFTFTDLAYQCDQDSQIYTVTLEDAAGAIASETVTITK
jgi:hypothetical protein